MKTMAQTIAITVEGKVQGVFYRQSTKEKATELNVTGVVKNLPNGNVFIIATGDTDKLNSLVAWCWEGPRRAVVTNVSYEFCALQTFSSFVIEQ